jgi:hypothetical protein
MHDNNTTNNIVGFVLTTRVIIMWIRSDQIVDLRSNQIESIYILFFFFKFKLILTELYII